VGATLYLLDALAQQSLGRSAHAHVDRATQQRPTARDEDLTLGQAFERSFGACGAAKANRARSRPIASGAVHRAFDHTMGPLSTHDVKVQRNRYVVARLL